MTTQIETSSYLPASLLDQDSHVLATGEAYVDTKTHLAEFFPSTSEDEDTLLKHASILKMTGGEIYDVQDIRRCSAMRLGHANPHYDIDLEPSA